MIKEKYDLLIEKIIEIFGACTRVKPWDVKSEQQLPACAIEVDNVNFNTDSFVSTLGFSVTFAYFAKTEDDLIVFLDNLNQFVYDYKDLIGFVDVSGEHFQNETKNRFLDHGFIITFDFE